MRKMEAVGLSMPSKKQQQTNNFHNLIHKLDRVTGKERAYANETLLV